jgi:hypothetical protein
MPALIPHPTPPSLHPLKKLIFIHQAFSKVTTTTTTNKQTNLSISRTLSKVNMHFHTKLLRNLEKNSIKAYKLKKKNIKISGITR